MNTVVYDSISVNLPDFEYFNCLSVYGIFYKLWLPIILIYLEIGILKFSKKYNIGSI